MLCSDQCKRRAVAVVVAVAAAVASIFASRELGCASSALTAPVSTTRPSSSTTARSYPRIDETRC